MLIPTKFVIPDWILEAVRVAPENWEAPKDSTTAKAVVGELNRILLNPALLAVVCDMVVQLSAIDNDVDEHTFKGLHDVFNQQQLIGEKRGLRQFFVKLNEIRDQLIETANKP